ncbi:MAG TPA: hypothetical protein VE959_08510 [Bryobacteraceae bacterium]|nr:hypothetical protein [Bryobacteraceae bacterium]
MTDFEQLEKRISQMDQLMMRIEDGLVVTNAIVDRHAGMVVDHDQWLADSTRAWVRHQEWLQQHEAALQEHESWRRQHEAAMQALDQKIDRIADLILKGRGGNGSGT